MYMYHPLLPLLLLLLLLLILFLLLFLYSSPANSKLNYTIMYNYTRNIKSILLQEKSGSAPDGHAGEIKKQYKFSKCSL